MGSGNSRMMVGMMAACMVMCLVPLVLIGGAGSVLLGVLAGASGWAVGGAAVVIVAGVTAVLLRRRSRRESSCCATPTQPRDPDPARETGIAE